MSELPQTSPSLRDQHVPQDQVPNNNNQQLQIPQNVNVQNQDSLNTSQISSTTASSTITPNTNHNEDVSRIIEWVNQIKDEKTRENALGELSRKRESFNDLALYIWYSTGTVSILLQEIIYTYQLLAPPKLNILTSNRACNVLALFQCVAAHQETRPAFLAAQIPIFLYPFLNTVNKTRPFEYLRLTALGVIGALVKVDNPDVIAFLLSTEIIPLCLRIMERGSELSRTVATFIVQRILLDENGLKYICGTAERFYAISSVLANMMNSNPSQRLIRHIIRAYARLADNQLVRSILKENIPPIMKDETFINNLDDSSKKWMINLNKSLTEKSPISPQIITNNNINVNPGNNLNMNMNMNMMMNPMNIQSQQGFMMQQPGNDFPYGMYNDSYMNKNIYMGNQQGNKNYGNMNPFYNNYKN